MTSKSVTAIGGTSSKKEKHKGVGHCDSLGGEGVGREAITDAPTALQEDSATGQASPLSKIDAEMGFVELPRPLFRR